LAARISPALPSSADLTSAYLRGANLNRADLVGANLADANLDGADLTDADYPGEPPEGWIKDSASGRLKRGAEPAPRE
jgi:hypothetical protein